MISTDLTAPVFNLRNLRNLRLNIFSFSKGKQEVEPQISQITQMKKSKPFLRGALNG